MRVALDLQGAQTPGSRNRGIGRYTMGLAGGLARAAGPDVDVCIALNGTFSGTIEPIKAALSPYLPESAFSVYLSPTSSDYAQVHDCELGLQAATAAARLHLASLEPDVILFSSPMEGFGPGDIAAFLPELPSIPSLAVIYDLIPLRDPMQFLQRKRYRSFYMRQLNVLRRLDGLLSISEATRQDVITHLDRAPTTVTNIGSACDPIFATTPRSARSECLPKRPYLLLLGGEDPNKNLSHAVRAFAALPNDLREGHVLLHVGVLSDEAQVGLRAIGGDSVALEFLGHVDDSILISAYDHAEIALFPSRAEGFGLPALEAMWRSTPVLASNTTSLPEVVGEAGLLTDPDHPEALSAAIERLLRNPDLRMRTGARLRARAKRFSWDKVGRAALEAMQEAAGDPGRKGLRPPPMYGVDDALDACAEPVASGAVRSHDAVDALIVSGRVGAQVGPPRLLVDVTETIARDPGTGIQRVVKRTVESLPACLTSEVSGRVTVPVRIGTGGQLCAAPRFGVAPEEQEGAALPLRTGDLLLMLDSSWLEYPAFASAFQAIRQYGGKVITAVYDLVPLLHPDVVAEGMADAFDVWLRRALIESDGLVCISEAVADELVTYICERGLPHRDGLRIGWWHLGSDISAANDDSGVVLDGPLDRFLDRSNEEALFLCVGTLEPRKRHVTALRAMERLWAEGLEARLLLMGREGWDMEALVAELRSHPEAGRRLLWVESPSDAELKRAYTSSTALLFPSVYEGFGLPVVEAARNGVGSICSDIPVLREIGGNGILYAPVDDVDAWADRIRAVACGDTRLNPSSTVLLSWNDSSKQLLEVLYADRWKTVMRREGTATTSARARGEEPTDRTFR